MVKAEAASVEVVSVDIPMTFKKRGGRKVIVLPDGTYGNPAPMATIDNTMIKAVARAFPVEWAGQRLQFGIGGRAG